MNMNDYQAKAGEFALYEDQFYPIASLSVEANELMDLFVKPVLRGDDKEINMDELISEAGDVLWNLSCLLEDNGITLQEVASKNIAKLASRMERGVIQGDGGDR